MIDAAGLWGVGVRYVSDRRRSVFRTNRAGPKQTKTPTTAGLTGEGLFSFIEVLVSGEGSGGNLPLSCPPWWEVRIYARHLSTATLGDLWMYPQLMWLQFEVVRGPLGVV